MRSRLTKVLHPVCGRPMIDWPVAAARAAGAGRIIVVDAPGEPLREHLAADVEVVVQPVRNGTAGAVRAGVELIQELAIEARQDSGAGGFDPVVVLSGDVPLITPQTIVGLTETHRHAGAGATMLTEVLEDPTGYGRVVRSENGDVERVVETKAGADATPEQLEIKEINAGIYAFDLAALVPALESVDSTNEQGELYLPDVLPAMRMDGWSIATRASEDPAETIGINDRLQLAQVRAIAQRRILEGHMLAGVTIVDPASTLIDVGVTIGEDTVIAPFCCLYGETKVGAGAAIGPQTTLFDTEVGDEATVIHSVVRSATIGDGANIGPFASLRPGTVMRERSKAGTFVEIKNSDVGAGTKVPHLSYIGDADIGEQTNLGASTITANYDGHKKHRTRIGSRVKTSVDTTLVAPVTVGDDVYTGAGSVITDDIPAGALGIARARQTNIDGYAARRSQRADAEHAERADAKRADAELAKSGEQRRERDDSD